MRSSSPTDILGSMVGLRDSRCCLEVLVAGSEEINHGGDRSSSPDVGARHGLWAESCMALITVRKPLPSSRYPSSRI
jgi:hypothetical protein